MEVVPPETIFNGVHTYAPWQVSLVEASSNTHVCGGVVLNALIILSAAHCWVRKGKDDDDTDDDELNYFRKSSEIRIVAGQYSLNWRDPSEQIRLPSSYVVPSIYSNSVLLGDIAIVYLRTPLKLNEKVTPLHLPPSDSIPRGNVTVSGWGLAGTLPGNVLDSVDTLQGTEMEIMSNEDCQLIYKNETIHGSMFCASTPGNVTALCKGDSGSPAVCTESTVYLDPPKTVERKVLCGLVSWRTGAQCEVNSSGAPVNVYPSVFTRVSWYVDWLSGQVRKHQFPAGWWMCDDYQLIREDQKCDFHEDCGDGSDESYGCPKDASITSLPNKSGTLSKSAEILACLFFGALFLTVICFK